MPKVPLNYQNTVIYKIVCNDLNITDVYVGHTTNFTKRKYEHKSATNNENGTKYNLKIYKTIRDNGGWENWSMIEIEKYPCNDLQEATKKERYYYELLNAKLNTVNPSRNNQEYYEDNKDKIREYIQEYRQEKKDKIREYNQEYRQENKDKILEYHQEYRQDNKDKIREDAKKYRALHKDKLKINKSKPIFCDCCNISITASHIAGHRKTKKHLNNVNQEII